jgi:hypothetical protein
MSRIQVLLSLRLRWRRWAGRYRNGRPSARTNVLGLYDEGARSGAFEPAQTVCWY